MAIHVATDRFLSIVKSSGGAAVDLSDNVKDLTLSRSADEHEVPAMGDTFKPRIGGLTDGSIEIEFYQDYDDNKVYDTLKDELGKVVTVATRPSKTDAVSATNPTTTVKCVVSADTPISGSVGEVAMFTVNWNFAGEPSVATS